MQIPKIVTINVGWLVAIGIAGIVLGAILSHI